MYTHGTGNCLWFYWVSFCVKMENLTIGFHAPISFVVNRFLGEASRDVMAQLSCGSFRFIRTSSIASIRASIPNTWRSPFYPSAASTLATSSSPPRVFYPPRPCSGGFAA